MKILMFWLVYVGRLGTFLGFSSRERNIRELKSLLFKHKTWVHKRRHLYLNFLKAIVLIFKKFSLSLKSFVKFLKKVCKSPGNWFSKLEIQALKLNTHFSKSLRIEIWVLSQDCQLTFDQDCTVRESKILIWRHAHSYINF